MAAMSCKVYVHIEEANRQPFTLPVEISNPVDTQFGTLKQTFIQHYNQQVSQEDQIDYSSWCLWNQDFCPIADKTVLPMFAWEHNDFFLRPMPVDEQSGALVSSQKNRGDLSYYYAHNRSNKPLISKPQNIVSAPVQQSTQHQKVKVAPRSKEFNFKQSPFGTNINNYETITSYTWEDANDTTVKVLVPLDGVGKLEPEKVRVNFGQRSFELLVDGYNGKNMRFACNKTHGFITPEECKHVVRSNRVNLVLRKAKEKDIWFDLFKKLAIGETEDD